MVNQLHIHTKKDFTLLTQILHEQRNENITTHDITDTADSFTICLYTFNVIIRFNSYIQQCMSVTYPEGFVFVSFNFKITATLKAALEQTSSHSSLITTVLTCTVLLRGHPSGVTRNPFRSEFKGNWLNCTELLNYYLFCRIYFVDNEV